MPEEEKIETQEVTIPLVVDADLSGFVKDMPQVVDDAVKAAEDKDATTKTKWETATDRKGRKFDPNIHQHDEKTGDPVLTPTGRFKRKLNQPNSQKQAQATASAAADPLMIEASQYADFFIMSYRGFAGDEATPEPGERESLISGWYAFFQKYGHIQLDPIFGLMIFHVAYIGRRAAKPKTKAVLSGLGSGIKNFFAGIFRKITGRGNKKNESES